MTVLTLLVKAYNPKQLKQVDDSLQAEFGNLDLDLKVLGTPVNKWVQVSLSGQDEVIATNYINKEIGICPISIKKIDTSSILKGYISKIDTEKHELAIDVGIFEPKIVKAAVPLKKLIAQLTHDCNFSSEKIPEIFGFRQNLPLIVKIVDLNVENEQLAAELSSTQIEKLIFWQESFLDRLIVLGATGNELAEVLERTRLDRDVVETEKLGFFEHALTCKLGTDATGLIPKIGRYMRNADFVVFNPRRIAGFIGEKALTL